MGKMIMKTKQLKVKITNILLNKRGEGSLEIAIFSVLHCYDRIATIRKRINSSLIKSRFKVDELINRSKVILLDQRGEGTISQAIFSVLHCYDRITTIRKRINSSLIKSRFKADELINRSKVILLDQRGEGTISQAISILSAVVLGSLLLMGIYKLIESTVLPELQQRIIDMFNYSS